MGDSYQSGPYLGSDPKEDPKEDPETQSDAVAMVM